MTAKRAVAIVVDTSVARSCGKEGTSDAGARACLDALEALRASGLWLAMSPAILEEWERHWSTFARRWLHKMRSSRRVRDVDPKQHGPTRKAAKSALDKEGRSAVAKDAMLVDAALAADRRVVSLDEKVRRYLCILAETVPDLRKIQWANPGLEECLAWLGRGAPDDARWHLQSPEPARAKPT